MYFKCIASSTKVDRNGMMFTPEALKQFEGITSQIYLGYDSSKPVGRIETAKVVDNCLVVTGVLNSRLEDFYIAPSCRMLDGYVDAEKDVKVVRSVAPMSYGLVQKHADPAATPIKEIKL